jgi:hypothetical protein
MTDHECGFCGGPDGVRFKVPGKLLDGAVCPDCAKAIAAAHAKRGSPQFAAARRAHAQKHARDGKP